MLTIFGGKTRPKRDHPPPRGGVGKRDRLTDTNLSDDDFQTVHEILHLIHIYDFLIVQLGKKLRRFEVSQIF